MSNRARLISGQEQLFLPDKPPVAPDPVDPKEGLTKQQTDEFDRLDAQGMRSAIGVRSEIGAAALTEKPSEFIEFEEDGVPVAIHRDVAIGIKSGKKTEPSKNYKPRSRRGLSGRQRLLADGPPADYDGR
jgi:hypothetical protein